MKLTIKSFACLLFVLCSSCLSAQPSNLRSFIEAELAAGKTNIFVPPARYYQAASNGTHLKFEGLKGVRIHAQGVEMVCIAPLGRAIEINECEDFEILGLTIDYDPLPFTQGEITAISEDGLTHEIRLFDGYPRADKVISFKYEIFNPKTLLLRCDTYYPESIEVVDSDRIKMHKSAKRYLGSSVPEQVGDWIVIAVGELSGQHTIVATDSKRLRFTDMTIYSSPLFGVLEIGCEASIYDGIIIDRRPLKDDLYEREVGRLRSLNADALHSKGATIGPKYIDCVIKFNGDDSIAINGHYHLVTETDGSKLRVISKRNDEFDIEAGDALQMVTLDGQVLPDASVVAVEFIGEIRPEEVTMASALKITPRLKPSKTTLRRAYEVILDAPLEIPPGTLIGSNHHMGDGFQVINCDVGYNRARGIICKSSNGLIQGNRVTNTWREGIKIAPEWYWLEAGNSRNIRIVGNTVSDCGGAGIGVYALLHGYKGVAAVGVHRDISIRDNQVSDCFQPSIFVTSTAGLELIGNQIRAPKVGKPLAFTGSYRLPEGKRELIELYNVKDVQKR